METPNETVDVVIVGAGPVGMSLAVVSMTDRVTRVATMKSPLGQSLRNASVAFLGHLPPPRSAVARKLAEVHADAP